jgi:ATP-dependent Lon protease
MAVNKNGVGFIKNEMNNIYKTDVSSLVDKKIDFFYDVIQKTIIHVQKNKSLDILGIADVSICVEKLNEISSKIKSNSTNVTKPVNQESIINELQYVNNELSTLLKNYGTEKLEDLILVCFGTNSKITSNYNEEIKLELLKKYFHPTSYKVVNQKEENKNKKPSNDSSNDEKTNNIDCSDIFTTVKPFHLKVYGLKVFITSPILKKSLLIYGIVDDVLIDYLNHPYILNKKKEFYEFIEKNHKNDKNDKTDKNLFDKKSYNNFISSLSLKDYLINNNISDLNNKFAGIISQNNNINQKQISCVVKEFITDDIYTKRNTLITLLVNSDSCENQYLSYLLYDLLSNDSNGNIDTQEQTILYDSFPWVIKEYFKNAMKKTIQYTNELSNFDINKIPLEQQICLLKAPDNVKEKAMMKLKEVKAKSEDSGTKARQYLDGLLKIPFGVYKKEPILSMMDKIKRQFKDLFYKHSIQKMITDIPEKSNYTSIEILKYLKKIETTIQMNNKNDEINKLKKCLTTGDKKTLVNNIGLINNILKKTNKSISKTKTTFLNKDELIEEINKLIDLCKDNNTIILNDFVNSFHALSHSNKNDNKKHLLNISSEIGSINDNISDIRKYMNNVKSTLDKAVYGHENAKRDIERIIAQWINGEECSHVLGFEGNPGVGKTTLAKGLADCLKDDNGVSRPYAFIALGGDANGSSLTGHSYTYVGAQHSQIIQILMDKKCMNPIIVLDEVDKISKTENGKEITGILTHLLDPTQNNAFQDKYFSGIDIDLSKVLFILSYNDVELIDRILLDRVQRIKFDSLSIEDKIIISNKYLLPELYKKIGLEDMIIIPDEVIQYIIEEYTLEPGVRKLKEKLFSIVGEINLSVFKDMNANIEIPIVITIEDIKTKYFKDKREVKIHKIHSNSQVGLINALWANQMSQGGVLPLQASFIPASKFLQLTLTGSMGDVMKESISVSLTNAWNLTSEERKKELIEKYNNKQNNNICGIHIHCPDISTKKDGPSATTAFTVLIYSLFNNIKIKNYFGITGETHFGLELTEIGGLQEKIIHSIKSGITEFIFPKENQKDFDKIMKKYKDNEIIKDIKFHPVSHINDVFDLILEK